MKGSLPRNDRLLLMHLKKTPHLTSYEVPAASLRKLVEAGFVSVGNFGVIEVTAKGNAELGNVA